MSFFTDLDLALRQAAKAENVEPMQNYMKNLFSYYGVRSPERRKIFAEIFKKWGLPSKETYKEQVLAMMNHPKREMHYSAIDLAIKCQKKYSTADDEPFIHELLCTNSWWDSVDGIAPNILGFHLKKYPTQVKNVMETYKKTDNIWLHRSCILFQLKYKKDTDKELLFDLCKHFGSSKEFFIQKGMGWALREYAKVNKQLVYEFVENTPLSNLSKREALKHKA